MFPLSAAGSPPAETSSADASSFGDLLAASFAAGDLTQGQDAGAGDPAAEFNTISFADAWFAGLTLDLNALNAGLEAEEAAIPVDALTVAQLPAGDSEIADATDAPAPDDAMLSALTVSLAAPVPVDVTPALPDADAAIAIATAAAATPETAVVPALSGRPGNPEAGPSLDAGRLRTEPTEETGISEARALSAPPGEPEGRALHAALSTMPTADGEGNEITAAVKQPSASASAAPDAAAPTPNAHVVATDAAVTGEADQAVAEAPNAGDVEPAVRPPARTRDGMAAKLAEISASAPRVEAAVKQAPPVGADSQAPTHDGASQEAFASVVTDTLAAGRPAEGGTAAPVFSVSPHVDGSAKAVTLAPSAPPQAPAAATVPDPENVGRLVESMRVQVRQGVQEATVRLNPEHLGEVTISVRVDRGSVSAVVRAETPAVQQWLESQEDRLRSGLSDQGLHLERFIVQRDGSQPRREQPRQQPRSAPQYRQQRDDATVRFEVLV